MAYFRKALLSLRKSILFFVVLFWVTASAAQTSFVQSYRDFRGYLFVFENGAPHQLESQAVSSFKSKGPYVAYVTSGNNLKVYYNSEVFDLGDATNTTYDISNELLIYKRDEVLAVFDKGIIILFKILLKTYYPSISFSSSFKMFSTATISIESLLCLTKTSDDN